MANEGTGAQPAGKPSALRRVWLFIEILNVRLRFIFLMVIVGFVVGYWENITNYYDRWRRPAKAADMVAAQDVEFYCPMHPNIIRSEPGNCPICGMPLAKRAKSGKAELPDGVLARQHLTPQKVQIGRIATSSVEYRLLSREVRTVGIVEYDETRRKFIAARIKGRIDKLFVNYVGQHVEAGDPLVSIYSPELLTAQQELLTAATRLNENSGADQFAARTSQSLLEASKQKLLLWGITPEQIETILKRGTTENHLTIVSPITGFVTEKKVLEGHYVDEGGDLYTVADLSNVWMQAKIFEDESGGMHVGTAVEVTSTADPGEVFAGRITFIAYQVDPATRTVSARVEIANPDLKLKPGMYAHATIRVSVGQVTEIKPPSASAPATAESVREAHAETGELIRAYLALSAAYVADKADPTALAALETTANELAKNAHGTMVSQAKAIAEEAAKLKGTDLAAQRGLFKSVNAKVIELLRGQPPASQTLYVVYCPMVEAEWLQDSEDIANPYMGSQMPKCGVLRGTITAKAVQENEQYVVGYYCPISPDHLFEKPELCPIDKFPLRFVRAEKMLAVPASAVINTGTRKIVYRESEPGTFDMVEVKLGKRTGEFYPVISGINASDRVATAGAFLVDAENRLNPAASAQFFGASGGPQQDGGHNH
ncbi:MAG: efflux RND transporter periplasmic adaptor subunit [Phycisphaerales bacterium]|nr:efflux RND transporter periplasmic adaptor subunit [Phycisphaerales bacterium]